MHELIERGSADVDRTDLGGHVLELGGFARLVHQHDTARCLPGVNTTLRYTVQ